MRTEHECSGISVALAECATRLFRMRQINIEIVVPLRISTLNRMMHHVARDYRVLTV